ncbi:putative mitochondrial 54s ribosomal protein 35 [Erysiphe necator]|uniref:Large ribosomal subunit protein mL38 n=1 Tax=Uncinula necator TaxID=52586 RepID=A0A0B1PA41_UNCNE|nr:putative mitochondrial 54s ribosomal protein 35 [Erysiphe necator]
MATCASYVSPFARYLKCNLISFNLVGGLKTFRRFSSLSQDVTIEKNMPIRTKLNPNTVTSRREERKLIRLGIFPIGSRRRRAAVKTSDNIPFEQLPYLCFQEARKILLEEREETLQKIKKQRLRISNLIAQDVSQIMGGQERKDSTLRSMKKYLEELKIQADLNDPIIKKCFEDGKGDMNKPVYRYLANEKWKSYHRKILVQRIEQFGIVPDLQPKFEPSAAVDLAFRRRRVQPGDYVNSRVSEVPARLKVQVFDKGERMISVIMIDADVPVVEIDNYIHRCHFLAVNIPISPTQTSLPLSKANPLTQLVIPWLPPFAQKGSGYHRYSIFVLQQPDGITFDVNSFKAKFSRDEFSLREFVHKYQLSPIGLGLFRSIWDEGTAGVMHRASISGADIVFKRKKVIALKPKSKPRGWEAKHAHPKYDAMLGKNRRPYSKILRKR